MDDVANISAMLAYTSYTHIECFTRLAILEVTVDAQVGAFALCPTISVFPESITVQCTNYTLQVQCFFFSRNIS